MPLQLGGENLVLCLGLGGGQLLRRLLFLALCIEIVLHYRTSGAIY